MYNFDKKSAFFEENKRFSGLIKYYAKRLKTDTAEADLWGFLWLLYCRENKPPNDKYIAVCLRNEYIRISKNIPKYCALDFEIKAFDSERDTKIDLEIALKKLTKKERETIILFYYYGYSIEEIGKSQNVSRQSVNKTKNRALEKLRNSVI